jgi:predicted TIM-barrel fold metal-dependent hydrolase
MIDGDRIPITNTNGVVGRPQEEWKVTLAKYEDMRDGVWDPRRRLADMDLCGVWASLCFGSIPWGFAGKRFSHMRDPEVGLASLRAYNDWMLEEWCGTDRDRLIPCQLSWLRDPEVGAAEIRRNAALGVPSVSFSENPEGLGFPNVYGTHWDPVFRACSETGTVINLHVGSSGSAAVVSSGSGVDVSVALFPMSAFGAALDWIYARIPIRFPDLKIALSEGGASWVPVLIERLERSWRQRDASDVWTSSDPHPADLLRRNFYFCSIEDPLAFTRLDAIGEDKVMVETDYPHNDSSWPGVQALLRSEMAGVLAPDKIRKVCYENAATLYRHPLPPAEMIARSEVAPASA